MWGTWGTMGISGDHNIPSCKGDPALVSAQPSFGQRRPRIVGDVTGRPPVASRLLFGMMLRGLRLERDVTAKEVYRATGIRESKLSRLEGGCHDFKEADLRALFAFYGRTDPQWIDHQLHAARQANERPWWHPWNDVSTNALQTHVSFEDVAHLIRSYEMQQLQGLLQIPDYTRALIRANAVAKSPAHIDRIVEFRQERQRRFFEHSEGFLLCLLDETTLARGYGTHEVMQRQMEHLLHLAETHPRRLGLRLVPLKALNQPVQIGSTTFFTFAEGALPTIIYTERPGRGEYLQDPDLVDEQMKAFDRLLGASLNQQACLRRIKDYHRSYRQSH